MRLIFVVLLCVAACGDEKKPAGGAPAAGKRGMAFPVQVAPVEARRVAYSVTAVGSVEAFETVQITARVSGVVEKVRFQEGDVVQKGTVLAEIEPDRYRLAVDAARATLSRATAARADAEAGLERREKVVAENPGLIPAEEIETFRTKLRTAAAEAQAAKVTLEQAELNLRDALVRAPAAGKIERRQVQTGQYAAPGAVLATLIQREPLLLRFKVPAEEAAPLAPSLVASFAIEGVEQPYEAKITHVSAVADPVSRMVDVTAEVTDARKGELRPGAFAEVTVGVGASDAATVIPETAIRPSEKGFLAFVVERDASSKDGGEVARERVLTLGLRTADGLVEVISGLRAGEQLVVRGAEALKDGVKIRIDAPGAPAKAPGASGEPAKAPGASGEPAGGSAPAKPKGQP